MDNGDQKAKLGAKCLKCDSPHLETDAQGVIYCSDCHLVIDRQQFDNNVMFGQHNQMFGKNINTQDKENQFSSERRLRRGREKIEDLKRQLEIDSNYDLAVEAANRLLKYTDNNGFFKKGKKVEMYAAAALYITLRFKKAPYLLIDFSDRMNVNLFKLARCYLRLSKRFGFQEELPLIDPSLFIHRYCRMLGLGDKTKAVTMTAIRLIKRMKRDWMCQGRRPSSLCGAAILIATKIHKVDSPSCSTTEICKTVFVCDETIRRRLDEFKQTKASKLTPEQFEREQQHEGVESEMDPPAFRKARLRSEQENQILRQAALSRSKNKLQWDEDIPQEVIKRYSDEIARNYEKASERAIPEPANIEEEEDEFDEFSSHSNDTGGRNQQEIDSQSSEIDEKMVFLDEKQQKERREIWEAQNRSWLDKQAARAKRGELECKRKNKRSKEKEGSATPYEAITKSFPGNSLNQEELKKLMSGHPKIEEPTGDAGMSLLQLYDPLGWNRSRR